VGHVVTLQPFRQVVRDIRGAVVGQQPWPMEDPGFVEPRGIQRHFERGGGLTSSAFIVVHSFQATIVAGEVVEDRREVEPSPANDLEISEVRLPELVWCRRLILELVRGFHHDEGWAGDQIAGLEEADRPTPPRQNSLRYR